MKIKESIERVTKKVMEKRAVFLDFGPVMYHTRGELLVCGVCGSSTSLAASQYPCPNHKFTSDHRNCKGSIK